MKRLLSLWRRTLGPHHMDMGDTDTVWVACVGMPATLS